MQKKTQKNLETNFGILTTVEMKIQVQSTKRKRRLSETEEETRSFCVNEDLMTLSDTMCFAISLVIVLVKLVIISVMN